MRIFIFSLSLFRHVTSSTSRKRPTGAAAWSRRFRSTTEKNACRMLALPGLSPRCMFSVSQWRRQPAGASVGGWVVGRSAQCCGRWGQEQVQQKPWLFSTIRLRFLFSRSRTAWSMYAEGPGIEGSESCVRCKQRPVVCMVERRLHGSSAKEGVQLVKLCES